MTRRGLLLIAMQTRDNDFAMKWNRFFAEAAAFADKYNHGPIDSRDPEAKKHKARISELWREVEGTKGWKQ